MALEEQYPNFGRSLVCEFFPGELLPWENEWWETSDAKQRRRLLDGARVQYNKQQEVLGVEKNI